MTINPPIAKRCGGWGSSAEMLLYRTGNQQETVRWLKERSGTLNPMDFSGRSGMFPVHMCWEPEPAYYRQHITEEGHKLGRPVEKFATVAFLYVLVSLVKIAFPL